MRLAIGTPKHRGTLWLLANVLWFCSIPVYWFYLDRELRAGAFATQRDMFIEFASWTVVVLVLSPVLNIAWWWLSRGYPGKVSLLVRPEPSFGVHGVSVVLIGLAAILGVGAIWEVLAGAPEVAVVTLSWCYLALAYRAAYVAAEKAINPVAA